MSGQMSARARDLPKEPICFAYLATSIKSPTARIENIIPMNNEATCEPDMNCNIISSKLVFILAQLTKFVNIVFLKIDKLF